jgi:hypothetical protein
MTTASRLPAFARASRSSAPIDVRPDRIARFRVPSGAADDERHAPRAEFALSR